MRKIQVQIKLQNTELNYIKDINPVCTIDSSPKIKEDPEKDIPGDVVCMLNDLQSFTSLTLDVF